ncbi:hypothetical protein [Maledivibacter halophilus]|uniref:hypothetical protein n=1 Tax=Maledivibacter halophilus TaxID=36842 RepID=UPI0009A8EEDA|nr:hypothetical protein [Maledivibacter halophilus]
MLGLRLHDLSKETSNPLAGFLAEEILQSPFKALNHGPVLGSNAELTKPASIAILSSLLRH